MSRKIFQSALTSDEALMSLKKSFSAYAVVFILWGLYRLLLRFPLIIEEVIIKPFILLPPVLSVLEQERSIRKPTLELLGFKRKNLLLSLYFGLTLGVSYFLAMGLGSLVFTRREVFGVLQLSLVELSSILSISLFTALWEQVIFSGFFLIRFKRIIADEWVCVTMVGLLFTFLHLPILIFEAQLRPYYMVIQLVLLFMVGFGNSVLMLRTRNIIAPILSHFFWAIALYMIV